MELLSTRLYLYLHAGGKTEIMWHEFGLVKLSQGDGASSDFNNTGSHHPHIYDCTYTLNEKQITLAWWYWITNAVTRARAHNDVNNTESHHPHIHVCTYKLKEKMRLPLHTTGLVTLSLRDRAHINFNSTWIHITHCLLTHWRETEITVAWC